MSLLESRWREVFEKFALQDKIDSEGYADISAKEIRDINIEPRLITKMDFYFQTPAFMREQGLSLVTLSRTTWRIGPYATHLPLPEWKPPPRTIKTFQIPPWLASLSGQTLSGESSALSAAFQSGMLSEFVGEEVQPTLSGRFSSGDFHFQIDAGNRLAEIAVSGAQIELDGGYEGVSALYLVEAKKRIAKDFNIRQLYYPLRTWSSRVDKPIKTIFLNVANDVFDFFEVVFEDLENYSSATVGRHERYLLGEGLPSAQELALVARSYVNNVAKIRLEVPYPQANDIDKIFELTDLLAESGRTTAEIASYFGFVERQSNYYVAAARFLGLIDSSSPGGSKTLSALGRDFARMSFREKYLKMAELLFADPVLARAYLQSLEQGSPSSASQIKAIMGQYGLAEVLGEETFIRRSSTASSWLRWLWKLDAAVVSESALESL